MSIQRFYRLCLWMPIVVPALLIVVAIAFRISVAQTGWVLELIGWSFWVGGLPYAVLALWASRRIGSASEYDIRRLMYLAPLLMVGVFAAFAIGLGVLLGRLDLHLRLALYAASIIIPLGYGYVAVTILLRALLRTKLATA
jgi:hypothetical protein